jgi:hypothetical protein
MGVNATRYPKLVEKESRKGTKLEVVQRLAAMKPDKYDKPSTLDKFIYKILKARKAKKLKGKVTTRTGQVTSGLKAAGLTDAELAKLRGKNG